MKKGEIKSRKAIHIATLMGIILLVIPASMNQSYIPLLLILMGVNLFNSSLATFNGKKIPLFLFLAFLPLLVYMGITLFK
ncbi:hypothetical protein [Ornithinibacillus bavariensis]|uniref:DUF3953 domain-containing protein n=1 Tax=Ornithinibacillus bavariensis TaxID=545502 RepID=A0A919XA56_9BACI|nr:hypothetical protein [Ornithinibacillus bavariensis]GIO28366.1 hypothetical protein J43TS3_29770 [Ornithinibacillus bavariensis]